MPLPKPKKGQSQSDYMAECMSEAYGSDAPDDRTQEQAVAMCMSAWRSEHGGKPPAKAAEIGEIIARMKDMLERDPSLTIITRLAEADMPDPEDDETHDAYIDRCIDELQADDDSIDDGEAENACEVYWEWNAAGGTEEAAEPWVEKMGLDPKHPRVRKSGTHVIKYKTHSETVNGMEFILSDETPDRMGDVIISEGWELTSFKKNPIALFNHNPNFPIGKWENLRVEKGSLRGHLRLAPEGTSERIDEIRRLIDAGILKAVSVGFVPIDSKPRKKSANEKASIAFVGEEYSKAELVETSLVAVPANPNALAVAKSLKISPSTIKRVFAEPGSDDTRAREKASTGEPAGTSRNGKGKAMSLAQRIKDAQERLTGLRDKLTTHLKTVDDTNVSDSQLEVTHELNAKIAQEEKGLGALQEAERHLAQSSEEEGGGNGNGSGTRSGPITALSVRAPAPGASRTPFNAPKTRQERFDVLARAGALMILAHRNRVNVDMASKQMVTAGYNYYGDEATRMLADYCARAATAPAMTSVTGWAAELVQIINADIMETLLPKSVFPRLSAMGLTLNFGRAGKISVPTRSRTPSIAGSFVGEGQPIPVRQGQFTAQVLTPKKMAVITTWTREIDEHSIPAIEGLLRQAIQEDTAVSLDSILLDANPATTIRPAGLFNGVTPLTPTAGGGFNALVGDLKNLSGAVLTATAGNVRNMCFLMNPQQMLSAGLISAPGTGTFPFKDEIGQGKLLTYPIIDSGTVPLGTVGALDAADFVSVGGEGPRFEVSDQATLHEEDTTPLPIVAGASPGTHATPVRSLWQTDSLALRLILPINWTLRRTGIVALVQGVTW